MEEETVGLDNSSKGRELRMGSKMARICHMKQVWGMMVPLRETRTLGIRADLGKQKICLIFNMLNLKTGHFIQMKTSKLMLQ